MNVLVFSWRDPKHPFAGGAEQVMHEHMKGWIEGGHNVTLFSSRFDNSPTREKIDGVSIIRAGHQYLGVQIAAFFYYMQNRENYDFVVDQFHGIPFFTPLYITKPKIAVIQETAREVWFLNPLPLPLNMIVGLIGFILEPLLFILYKNTKFMTGSDSAREDIARFGIPKKNISVVPHGVIVEKPKKAISKEKIKTIVFLGMLSKDKGIEDAIRVFSILDKKGKFNFWVIGKAESNNYKKYLENLVSELKLDKKVRFWGFISQEQKFELLSVAHVLINPSKREGWGLVNIEANSVGIPVVAFNSRGLIDSVIDEYSGLICLQNTPESMADSVYNLIVDNERYQALSGNAINWSRKFTWDNSCALSLKLINRLKDD